MSKTNFDDIDLGGRGIEAGEINSEAATVGQVLAADGAGGAAWATPGGFVTAHSTGLLALEDGGDVAWTDLGLAGFGVPVAAKAILLTLYIEDSGGTIQVNFRPNGSSWSNAPELSPCLKTTNPAAGMATLIVPCGSGEVEYRVDTSGAETAYVYGTLLGYWL